MMASFDESGHAVFRETSPLSSALLKSKGGGKVSIHFNAKPKTAELLLRTIVYASQLRTYGAVAGWCQGLFSEPQPFWLKWLVCSR